MTTLLRQEQPLVNLKDNMPLGRYVTEFAGRHNVRELDTIEQMKSVVKGIVGKKLEYKELTSD